MKNKTFADPGQLAHRLELQQPQEVPDGCGGLEVTWTPAGHVWAKLVPARENQNLQADQSRETVSHLTTIRFRNDVASGWRFVLGDRVFTILTIHDPDERRAFLVARTVEEGR